MATRAKRLIAVRFRADRRLWEVDYRDQHGKRHRPLFETEADALGRAAKVREELEQRLPLLDDPDRTLRSYVEWWLEAGTQEMEPKTRESYRHLLQVHVLPTLGALRLRDLLRRHVKTLLALKRAERVPRKHQARQTHKGTTPPKAPAGYSKNTVRLIKAALSTVLSDAVDDGYVPTNPAFGAGRKRGRRAETLTASERLQKIRPLSWEDRDVLLTAAASSRRYHALFSVLLKAGLRPGEAFALTPADLDLKRQTIRVERAATMGGRIKDTKTHEVRNVDLTRDLALTLRRYLTWLRAEALQQGQGEPERLFTRPDGALMDKDHAAAVFRRLLKRAKLSPYRVYDCRHTYASLLLNAGAPITYVAQQLGHSSPATTLRHYAKWVKGQGRRWVDLLDRRASAAAKMEPESGTSANGKTASV
jgi:integrase